MRLLVAILAFGTATAMADGGVVIGRQEKDGLTTTVFANPFPVRAGPTDFSVLLQRGSEPVLNEAVRFSFRKSSSGGETYYPPCCSMKGAEGAVEATRTHSKNKLLQGAMMTVPESGDWLLEVHVGSNGTVLQFPFQAKPPKRPMESWWPFLALLPAAIAVYAWRTRLTSPRA